MIKSTSNPLLQELDSILAMQGKSFGSAVREYRATITEMASDEEREDAKWIDKFKKYRTRLSSNPKAKSYIELQKLLSHFRDQNVIKPAPLLHLVDDDVFSDSMIKTISKKIRDEIRDG